MKIMNELIQEHTIGRATSAHLVVLVLDYQRGHAETLPVIVQDLKTFVNFYPRHIAKEDKVFFPSITKYFSNQEQQAMLGQFRDFDKELIHEKYRMIVESFEK
jgi:hemerythrin-like domain-containing protein